MSCSNVLPSSRLEDIIQRTEVCQGLLVFASERDAEAYASSSSSSKNLVACEADAFDVRSNFNHQPPDTCTALSDRIGTLSGS